MQRHRGTILGIQWSVVGCYLILLIWPAFLPLPREYVHIYDDLILFAQFLFWGIWWPFVIISVMLLGRVWCGVFCPEGKLTEWVSCHGRGGAIPKWIQWSGWPFVAFSSTTIYGQMVSVYEYPKAALVVLGGSTAAAMLIGFLYGKGKRVWCRYLCPVNGVFALLSRLAPVHFQVDREVWRKAPHRTTAVDCKPLINIPAMTGISTCHMCGRCSGHREAVALAARSPNRETLLLQDKHVSRWEVCLLLFGMLGIATGAFQWSASPWFVMLKQYLAKCLIDWNSFWMLQDNAPWWLLTHYPETNDVFTWLDGFTILLYLGGTALAVGGGMLLLLRLAGWMLGQKEIPWRLAYGMTPLAGISVFIGLSALTVSMLRAERIDLSWVSYVRITLLTVAILWSGQLTWRILGTFHRVSLLRRLTAWHLMMTSTGFIVALWVLMFYVW